MHTAFRFLYLLLWLRLQLLGKWFHVLECDWWRILRRHYRQNQQSTATAATLLKIQKPVYLKCTRHTPYEIKLLSSFIFILFFLKESFSLEFTTLFSFNRNEERLVIQSLILVENINFTISLWHIGFCYIYTDNFDHFIIIIIIL